MVGPYNRGYRWAVLKELARGRCDRASSSREWGLLYSGLTEVKPKMAKSELGLGLEHRVRGDESHMEADAEASEMSGACAAKPIVSIKGGGCV